jgi:transmembrane sensor
MIQRASEPPVPGDPGSDADSREFESFESFALGQDPLDIEAATWVARKRNGLSAADEAEWRAWLAADPRHGAAFEDMDETFGQVRGLPDDQVDALKAGLAPPIGPVVPPRTVAAPQERPRLVSPGRRAWMTHICSLFPQAAAAGIALAMMGGGWVGWQHWQSQPTFEKTYATARGQQLTVSLPDYSASNPTPNPTSGSTLMLDTATQAEVRLYRDRREVRLLDGQAMFTVRADAKRPFHVFVGSLRVTVVGTRFSVRHTQSGLGAGQTVVSVEEGRVRVAKATSANGDNEVLSAAGSTGNATVELTAGQMVVADEAGRLGRVASVPASSIAAWRDGRLSFDQTPLSQAIAEFERYVHTGLMVRDPAVAALPVGGSYSLKQWRRFAETLPEVLPVRLERRGEVTEVVAK